MASSSTPRLSAEVYPSSRDETFDPQPPRRIARPLWTHRLCDQAPLIECQPMTHSVPKFPKIHRYWERNGTVLSYTFVAFLTGTVVTARAEEIIACASVVCLPEAGRKETLAQHQGTGPALLALQLYQRRISPLMGPKCGFKPSCSRYSVQAIHRYGILKGLAMTADRLLRCHYCAGLYYPREHGLLVDVVPVRGEDEQ